MPDDVSFLNQSSTFPYDPKEVLTIEELTTTLNMVFRNNTRLRRLLLRGEINELSQKRGIFYFRLLDYNAKREVVSLPCVCFPQDAARIEEPLADGAKVVIEGALNIYPARTQLQLIVRQVYTQGEGQEKKRLQALFDQFAKEGLFEPRPIPFPRFPKRIAVLTSLQGKALGDILHELKVHAPFYRILLVDSYVQGDKAAGSLIKNIHQINAFYELSQQWQADPHLDPDTKKALLASIEDMVCDVLVLARGGGSQQDLSIYNDETLARTLWASKLPTIVAVGHTADISLCDKVADRICNTPTQVAHALYPFGRQEVLTRLSHFQTRINQVIGQKLGNSSLNLLQLGRRIESKNPQAVLKVRRQELQRLHSGLCALAPAITGQKLRTLQAFNLRIGYLVEKTMRQAEASLRKQEAKIEALAPQRVLERGYLVGRRVKDQRLVSKTLDIRVQDSLLLQFFDGLALVNVSGVYPGIQFTDIREDDRQGTAAQVKDYLDRLSARPSLEGKEGEDEEEK